MFSVLARNGAVVVVLKMMGEFMGEIIRACGVRHENCLRRNIERDGYAPAVRCRFRDRHNFFNLDLRDIANVGRRLRDRQIHDLGDAFDELCCPRLIGCSELW